jgi:dipeptidase D
VVLPENESEKLVEDFEQFNSDVLFEFERAEPKLKLAMEKTEMPDFVVDGETQKKLMNALIACPHGVLEMSTRMEGMVETSTNLASVKFIEDNKIMVTTSQRSEIESRKYFAAQIVEAVFNLADAEVVHSDGYPGWTPNPDSEVLKITVKSYEKILV